jgi:two-component system sensor histidine kinase/response regulator
MTSQWLALLAGVLLLVTIGMLIAAYIKVKRQNFLIRLQSREIQKQIRELIQQNEASEHLLREKKQLILLVSHDLKGPFNRIFALMQLLEMSGTYSEEQKEYLGKMYQIVGDGLNMVRNLVDVRRLEERGVDPHPERIDLAYLVTSIVNQYRVAAGKKKITVNVKAPPRLEFITDKNYVARIMENLLSNAIKFSPPEKNVHVMVTGEPDGRVSIAVRDEGPGISPEDQRKLYLRFQKLGARPTGGESSTGLGLSIIKMLATSMGGDISCESELEKGATFLVRLPELKVRPTTPVPEQAKVS